MEHVTPPAPKAQGQRRTLWARNVKTGAGALMTLLAIQGCAGAAPPASQWGGAMHFASPGAASASAATAPSGAEAAYAMAQATASFRDPRTGAFSRISMVRKKSDERVVCGTLENKAPGKAGKMLFAVELDTDKTSFAEPPRGKPKSPALTWISKRASGPFRHCPGRAGKRVRQAGWGEASGPAWIPHTSSYTFAAGRLFEKGFAMDRPVFGSMDGEHFVCLKVAGRPKGKNQKETRYALINAVTGSGTSLPTQGSEAAQRIKTGMGRKLLREAWQICRGA